MGKIAVLDLIKLIFMHGDQSVGHKRLPGRLRQIISHTGEIPTRARAAQGRQESCRLQDTLQRGLKEVLHDDLSPVGAANAAARLVPKGVDPARPVKAPAAIQAVGREGAKRHLLFGPVLNQLFLVFMGS